MKDEKIKLSFINEGKPFIIPNMTVKRQEELMEEMKSKDGKIGDMEYNREVNKLFVLKTLQVIDKNLTMDDINNMHPDDFVRLFSMIWNKGKELSGEQVDFQETK